MKLYLLRHATATDVAPSDERRELTREGREEAWVAGEALAKLGVKPSYVLSSPLTRARQTAEIVAKVLSFSKEIELIEELKNNASTTALLKALKSCASGREILLIGHMPSLAEHLAAFIGAKTPQGLPVDKGAVACVELEALCAGAGQLRWLIGQHQLCAVAG